MSGKYFFVKIYIGYACFAGVSDMDISKKHYLNNDLAKIMLILAEILSELILFIRFPTRFQRKNNNPDTQMTFSD